MLQITPQLTFQEFQRVFPDEQTCLQYLAKTKWAEGFQCPRCRNDKYCQGRSEYHLQCTRCKYQSSPTSNTIFHRVRFPLNNAFYILFFMLRTNRRLSSTELSQKIGLRQKTCWFFQEKIRKKIWEKDYDQLVKIVRDAEDAIKAKALNENSGERNMVNTKPAANHKVSLENMKKRETRVLNQN